MSEMKFVFLFFLLVDNWSYKSINDSSFIFHDDFESYEKGTIPNGSWEKEGNGKIVVDDTRSVSGSKSIKFITDEGYQERGFLKLSEGSAFPSEVNEYYGSVNFWVKKASPDGIHWTMIETKGQVAGQDFVAMMRYGGQHKGSLMANYDTDGIQTDCWQHSKTKLPEEKWFNVQWYFNAEKNQAKFWLDNQLIEDLVVDSVGEGCVGNDNGGLWSFPKVNEILIGWVDYQTGGGKRELWIDDFILSTKRIGN